MPALRPEWDRKWARREAGRLVSRLSSERGVTDGRRPILPAVLPLAGIPSFAGIWPFALPQFGPTWTPPETLLVQHRGSFVQFSQATCCWWHCGAQTRRVRSLIIGNASAHDAQNAAPAQRVADRNPKMPMRMVRDANCWHSGLVTSSIPINCLAVLQMPSSCLAINPGN